MENKVSIIITTKNSAKTLTACLYSVVNASYSHKEIIVVDNFSTDDTSTIANNFGVDFYRKGSERSAQRNFGAKKATGEYLLFLDADMVIHPKLIRECVKELEIKQMHYGYNNGWFIKYTFTIDGLYIPEIILGNSFWQRVRNFERSFYTGTCVDAVRFIRKSHFIGFDENLTGVEDWDFDRRFSGRKGVVSLPIYHLESKNPLEHIQRKDYYYKWFKAYKEKHKKCQALSPSYRFVGVFVENFKFLKILRHPILFMGVLALKTITAFRYWENRNG